MKKFFLTAVALVFAFCAKAEIPVGYGLPHVAPEAVGMSSDRLSKIDDIVNDAIARKDFPGAVVAVVRGQQICYMKAYGKKAWVPAEEPMTVESVFDLASLSKCVGTTLSFMQLVEDGKVRLSDNVCDYIPEFAPWVNPENSNEKVHITIENLLTHTSGIDSYINVKNYCKSHPAGQPDSLIHYIAVNTGRHFRPGTGYIYSCLNFVTLQNILQRVTGEKLCDYAQKNVFDRLGMQNTRYYPIGTKIDAETLANICPTEVQEDGLPYRGQVHDPIANILNNGNSGNAGVFSNAEDLAIVAAAMFGHGQWNGRRVLSPLTVDKMLTVPANQPKHVGRALGWDAKNWYSELFSKNSFNHTGYTGTAMAFDMENQLAVIILTNRAHPNDGGAVSQTRALVCNVAASAVMEKRCDCTFGCGKPEGGELHRYKYGKPGKRISR